MGEEYLVAAITGAAEKRSWCRRVRGNIVAIVELRQRGCVAVNKADSGLVVCVAVQK